MVGTYTRISERGVEFNIGGGISGLFVRKALLVLAVIVLTRGVCQPVSPTGESPRTAKSALFLNFAFWSLWCYSATSRVDLHLEKHLASSAEGAGIQLLRRPSEAPGSELWGFGNQDLGFRV